MLLAYFGGLNQFASNSMYKGVVSVLPILSESVYANSALLPFNDMSMENPKILSVAMQKMNALH